MNWEIIVFLAYFIILLGVALGIGLLEGDIRDRQRGALRHGTAGVSAGIRHIVVGIQTQFLLI